MSSQRKLFVALVAVFAAMSVPLAAGASAAGGKTWTEPNLGAASGSAVGPGGALYVPQPATGEIWRIDPETGAKTPFASGLPTKFAELPFGGVMDVAFIGSTAYALVSVVPTARPYVLPDDLLKCAPPRVGIYRVDGPASATLVADIGTFSCDNPPPTSFFVPTGVQYALEPFRGGFLVTDGHHNRVLYVTRDGGISVVKQFTDIVPTGLSVHGDTIYMAEAGPVPHLPQTGKVVAFSPGGSTAEVAAGARLAVDVERGRGQTLFALSQGHFSCVDPNTTDCPQDAGKPADPNTGSLMRVNTNGTMTAIASGLNQPTSLEIIGNTAYVVTLGGHVVKIDDIADPPYGG